MIQTIAISFAITHLVMTGTHAITVTSLTAFIVKYVHVKQQRYIQAVRSPAVMQSYNKCYVRERVILLFLLFLRCYRIYYLSAGLSSQPCV